MINPSDSPEAFAWQMDAWDTDTLVVGHLPFMAKLISYLMIGEEQPPLVSYQPGSIVCLAHDENKRWAVAWMLRPELLSS